MSAFPFFREKIINFSKLNRVTIFWVSNLGSVTDEEAMGPFCNEKRKRRSYPASKNTAYGKNYKTEEMDLVFRNGQSLKFKFGFQLRWPQKMSKGLILVDYNS